MYEIITQNIDNVDRRANQKKKWGKSISKSKNLLPKLGFVACAASFETFVQDAIRRCVDTVFRTRTIAFGDQEYWKEECKKWLKARKTEARRWDEIEHEDEKSLWSKFFSGDENEDGKSFCSELFSSAQESSRPPTDEKLKLKLEEKVISQLLKDPTSQGAVGLLQEIVNARKQRIMRERPTWECVEETFRNLVTEYSKFPKAPPVIQPEQSSTTSTRSPPKRLKTSVDSDKHLIPSKPSPKTSTPLMQEKETPRTHSKISRKKQLFGKTSSKKVSIGKLTPDKTRASGKSQAVSGTQSKQDSLPNEHKDREAIRTLCKRYTKENTWNTWLHLPETADVID